MRQALGARVARLEATARAVMGKPTIDFARLSTPLLRRLVDARDISQLSSDDPAELEAARREPNEGRDNGEP
jgi:hypothetical protein